MKIAETPCGTKLSQRLLLVRCLIVLCLLLLLLLVYKYVKIGKIISSKMLQTKNGGWVLNSVCHLRLKGTKVYSCATSIIWLHVSEDHIYSTDLSTFIVRRMSLDWQASVSPVYDKGYKQLPENYMPVFLTCTCSKIMEQFLFQIFFATLRVIIYLTILSIVADNSNLLRLSWLVSNSLMLQRICRIYMIGGPDVFLTDFSKAATTVPHEEGVFTI